MVKHGQKLLKMVRKWEKMVKNVRTLKKIFGAQTFLIQSLPDPNFFKPSVPGGLRIFIAFASLFCQWMIKYGKKNIILISVWQIPEYVLCVSLRKYLIFLDTHMISDLLNWTFIYLLSYKDDALKVLFTSI